MEKNIKNYLSVAIIIAVLALGYAVVVYSRAYSRSAEPANFRSFSVSGDGKTVAIPDVATFKFKVITEGGKDIGKLQDENTSKVNKIIDFVKSERVDPKDIQTQSYYVDPRYQYYSCGVQPLSSVAPALPVPCPPSEIVGYTISQLVEVKVRDFSKIGDIMGGVVKNGANSVSNLSFTIDDPTKAQNEAREQAISKAKDKAEAIAKAGGFHIGRLLEVYESGQPQPYYDYGIGGGGMETKAMSAPAPVIEPGSQEVKVTVTLRYEIQ